MGKPWLKLWTETIHDRKLTRVSPTWRWAWVGLLALAAETDDEGKLELSTGVPLTDQDIADEVAIDLADWLQAKAYFLRLGMLRQDTETMTVANYAKRQASSDPTAAARMQKHRDTKNTNVTRNVTRNTEPNVTQLLRVESEAEVEEETEVEEEGERHFVPAPPVESVANGKRYSQKMAALNAQVPAVTRNPLAEKLADFYGLTAWLEIGKDADHYALHQEAVQIYQLGCHTVEMLDGIIKAWRSVWPGKNGDIPKKDEFPKFVSRQVQLTKGKAPKSPQKRMVVDAATGASYEVTI